MSPLVAQTDTDAKAEVEGLMNASIPFAEQSLAKNGSFNPFGRVINESGEFNYVMPFDESESMNSTDLIEMIKAGFRKSAASGTIRASALFYDVRIKHPSSGEMIDAIAVNLDHKQAYSIVILLPYYIENQVVSFGSLFAEEGDNNIFLP